MMNLTLMCTLYIHTPHTTIYIYNVYCINTSSSPHQKLTVHHSTFKTPLCPYTLLKLGLLWSF